MKYIFACFLSLSIQNLVHAQVKDADINTIIPGAREQLHGLRSFKTVLPGVLYRGGGSGGTKPMSEIQLNALCKAGFSGAGYLYRNGMTGAQTVSCLNQAGHKNELRYSVYGFRPRNERYKTLQAIRDVIQTRQGPLFMHCWNGWHASGEIAAIALMQFCDWSGKRAGDYWKANVSDKGNLPRYRSIYETHIGTFVPFENLKISAEDQRRICP